MSGAYSKPMPWSGGGSTKPPVANNYLDSHGLNPGLGNAGHASFPSVVTARHAGTVSHTTSARGGSSGGFHVHSRLLGSLLGSAAPGGEIGLGADGVHGVFERLGALFDALIFVGL